MKKNLMPYGSVLLCCQLFATFFYFSLISSPVNAQSYCANETVYWLQTFGKGTSPTSNAGVIESALTYQENDPLLNIGVYRVANNTHQKPEWHACADHTLNDADGKMLVVNGSGKVFYRHTLNRSQGFAPGSYSSSLFLMNVNIPGTCGPEALLPTISFIVQYLDMDNKWISLQGSPVTVASVKQTDSPTWIQLGGIFTLPSDINCKVTAIRITLADGTIGGCGNDFAIDDISFALCPAGSPLPVNFLSLNAKQKGSGINITWATSSETNSKYFEAEQSNTGNSNWHTVASVQGADNYSAVKTYNVYDAKPVSGLNYYRIKQVDKDNVFKYSKTVNVKITLDKTGITVLSNPFYNMIIVDFLSKNNQLVSVRLLDITGRNITEQKWNIAAGSTRKQLTDLTHLQKGMYYLSLRDESGAVLLNSKLLKQ